jgi:hypothetical protein
MRRFVLVLVASLGLTGATSLGAGADIGLTETTQATLSCSDGHSVVLSVDPTTLTNLTADVNAINLSGTGLNCALETAAIDPSMQTTEWTVYDYNPSGQAIAPRNSPSKMPATTPDGGNTWQFPFKPDVYTALFTTTDPGVTGNDFGKTLKDTITVMGDATTFMTQRGGGDCVGNTPAAVRFYFRSPAASGPSTGTPPAGFYTQFWWSDVQHMDLLNGAFQTQTLTESMTPADWSDWNGQPASEFPLTFAQAASHVQSIGLSFGGDCFFETGVTPSPDTFTGEQFSSMFSVN